MYNIIMHKKVLEEYSELRTLAKVLLDELCKCDKEGPYGTDNQFAVMELAEFYERCNLEPLPGRAACNTGTLIDGCMYGVRQVSAGGPLITPDDEHEAYKRRNRGVPLVHGLSEEEVATADKWLGKIRVSELDEDQEGAHLLKVLRALRALHL